MRHGAPGASLESGPKSSQARIHAHAAQLRRPRANAAAIPWCPRPPVRHPKSSAAFRDDRPGTGKFECVRRYDRARRQCRLPAFVDRTGSPVIRCSPVLANDQTLTFETHPAPSLSTVPAIGVSIISILVHPVDQAGKLEARLPDGEGVHVRLAALPLGSVSNSRICYWHSLSALWLDGHHCHRVQQHRSPLH
jgi:hypothetical protein